MKQYSVNLIRLNELMNILSGNLLLQNAELPVANIVLRQAGKGEGGFSCEEKQTGKKPSDFTFANARGKTHITAVFGFNFNRKSRSQATQSLKNKT